VNEIFADSFFFIALLNPSDQHHAAVVAASSGLSAPLVTTEPVLIELADALSAPANRLRVAAFCAGLAEDPGTRVVPLDSRLFGRALDLYSGRPDKDWSLTDCRVWDLDSRLSRTYVSGPGVSALAYSPDGGLLAAIGAPETCVRIWDARAHEPLPTFAGHSVPIRSVAFAPDGRMMATAAGDGTAAVWSVATRRELRRLDGRADLLSHVAFSPDGLTLVGTGNDDDIRFWDLRGLVADRAER
jgi:WD40 repeat protein